MEGDKTIQVKDWIANMRADCDLFYRALYHEQALAETFGNRKLADYQFKVGQDILINQQKHPRKQLSAVGSMTAKAVDPFKIKRQITHNTLEIDIRTAIRRR